MNTDKLPISLNYFEDFENEQHTWAIEEIASLKTTIENGRFIYDVKGSTGYRTWWNYDFKPNQDYYYEMKFKKLRGPDEEYSGIIFNHSTTKNDNEYLFELNKTKIRILGKEDGTIIYEKKFSIKTPLEPNADITLGIYVKGKKIHYYLNRVHFYSDNKPNFLGSDLGISGGPYTKLAVDHIKLFYNSESFEELENAPIQVELQNVGAKINSNLAEISPVVSADGNLMFFSRVELIGNIGHERKTLMYSTKVKDQWEDAKVLPGNLNSGEVPQIIHVSSDKNMLYLNGQYSNGEMISNEGFSISRKTKDGWSNPENQLIEGFSNESIYNFYSFSENNKIAIISYHSESTVGQRDLHVTFKKGNSWTKPLNLGSVVNTYSHEDSPCLAPYNVTLYYSTSGKSGYGKADVYMTRRLDDSWTKWSEPVNLGQAINNEDDNFDFKVDAFGDWAYISKTTSQKTQSDIFRIHVPENAKPEPVVLVKGQVINALNGEPIEADISVFNIESGIEDGIATSNPNDGSFIIILPTDKNFTIFAKANGYISESLPFTLLDADISSTYEAKADIKMHPVREGETLHLRSIFFEPQKFELRESSYTELRRLILLLNEHPNVEIEISGHTDNLNPQSRDEVLNLLSLNRAKAVKNYLISNGILPSRLNAIGYGRTRPISDDQRLNRRVEIKITKM